jgi:hypothetical protein
MEERVLSIGLSYELPKIEKGFLLAMLVRDDTPIKRAVAYRPLEAT